MRRLTLLTILLTIATASVAQRSLFKKGETHFARFEYRDAADAYGKLLLIDSTNRTAMEKLIACYQKLNDAASALPWLRKICANGTAESSFNNAFADALAATGQYTEAIKWYQLSLNKTNDATVSKKVAALTNMKSFYADSANYTLTRLAINSPFADFSPAFYGDELLFSSARANEKKNSHYAWDHSAYIDLYVTTDHISQSSPLGKPVNSAVHEGPATLNAGNDTLFFTRNKRTSQQTHGKKPVGLQIMFSVRKNGVWKNPEPFVLNHEDYSTGHPAFAGANKLYFVSDMPGGFGGTDLYYTERVNGLWSTPKNLGATVNSRGNELFPFVDSEGNLYFASNGYPGLGGLDIFVATYKDLAFENPRNLGYPVNSSADDFGWIQKNSIAYFSSNRGNSPGDDDIYKVAIDSTKPIQFVAEEKGTTHRLNDFQIKLVSGNREKTIEVADQFKTRLHPDSTYHVEVIKDGFTNAAYTFSPEQPAGTVNGIMTFHLVPETITVILNSKTISADNAIVPFCQIVIKDRNTGQSFDIQSNANGMATTSLLAGHSYDIAASKTSFKTQTLSLENIATKTHTTTIDIVLTPTTTLFEKNELGQIIELDIRYDVNKATIRKDAALQLDQLVMFLKKNPTVKVELGSHTDSRGSNQANLVLSQKRAASSAQYIASKGISSTRIVPVGYGEEDLKIKSAETDDEHQQNRRTTVKIVGL